MGAAWQAATRIGAGIVVDGISCWVVVVVEVEIERRSQLFFSFCSQSQIQKLFKARDKDEVV